MEQDQYGMQADLRQYMSSSRPNLFPVIPPPPENLLSGGLGPPNPYDMLMFRSHDTTANNTVAAASTNCSLSGFDNSGGGTGRWPRQETLTLLEIRSRLDSKFKEANQKGPLWDEVSRIMSEEHGYQRSGKKCREKFENLYKYYKKTREGKAGRQDGKHYRFFRQLEALYGDTNNNNNNNNSAHILGGNINYFPNNNNNNPSIPHNQEAFQGTSLSFSNYSDSETTNSSDNSDPNDQGIDDNGQEKMKKKGNMNWKVKIKDFIDYQMKKLMDKQEAWMDKMVKTIEQKEHERMLREDEWRKQDALRIEKEHKFWASERAWIEARDAAIMDTLHKFTSKEMVRGEMQNQDDGGGESMNNISSKGGVIWPECEINRLIQLRSGMEVKFDQSGICDEILWEEIARKMACFGHERSGVMCKEKWDGINNYVLKCNKKRKEMFYQNHESIGGAYCDEEQQGGDHHAIMRLNDHGNSSSSPNDHSNRGNNINDNCFRYFMGDPYGRIMD